MGILSSRATNGDNEMRLDFHFPTSKKALIIFTRNPELGKCKTRLAATIGNESALEIYKYLLQHTANIAKDIKADKYVFYSENIKKNDLWDSGIFRKKMQNGLDLGERMHNAFAELFNLRYEKVAIIGSDLLDLEATTVNDAFEKLEHHDVVIGPSVDGGYYLLAKKNPFPKVFVNKDWGTSSVLKETLEDLKHSDVHLLKELNDIDTFEDIQHYSELKKFYTIYD